MTHHASSAAAHAHLALIVLISSMAISSMTNHALAQAPASLRCASLLTAAELQKAVGEAFESVGADVKNPGETECGWFARTPGGVKTVSLQFYDRTYIANTPSKTVDGFYGMMSEPSATEKMTPLPGVGVKAVFVTGDPQNGAYVQLADGVARVVANNLTQSQVVAVARAVTTP
jgi:hypothetical protein